MSNSLDEIIELLRMAAAHTAGDTEPYCEQIAKPNREELQHMAEQDREMKKLRTLFKRVRSGPGGLRLAARKRGIIQRGKVK